MSQYTTGEMAKLCDVSVRTVQFYDTKNLLKPSELTEGGRRLYSDSDLSKMRLICLLKSLGLSLDAIKGVLESEAPNKVLELLLNEREKELDEELNEKLHQKKSIVAVKKSIESGEIVSVNSICDIEDMMRGNKELRRTRGIMLTVGIVLDALELCALLLWIFKGIWQPFAVIMPFVIIVCAMLVRMYYRAAAYICPDCNEKFRPGMKEFFFAKHTAKTRRLTCTACGKQDWCVETYADDNEN